MSHFNSSFFTLSSTLCLTEAGEDVEGSPWGEGSVEQDGQPHRSCHSGWRPQGENCGLAENYGVLEQLFSLSLLVFRFQQNTVVTILC